MKEEELDGLLGRQTNKEAHQIKKKSKQNKATTTMINFQDGCLASSSPSWPETKYWQLKTKALWAFSSAEYAPCLQTSITSSRPDQDIFISHFWTYQPPRLCSNWPLLEGEEASKTSTPTTLEKRLGLSFLRPCLFFRSLCVHGMCVQSLILKSLSLLAESVFSCLLLFSLLLSLAFVLLSCLSIL